MQEGTESAGKLVVSRGDASELLEPIKEALDKMTSLVTMPVDVSLGFTVAARRDVSQGLGRFDCFNELVAVVTLVSRDCSGRDINK